MEGECLAKFQPNEQWRCMFAENAVHFVRAPIFLINSAIDAWQIQCILDAILPVNFPHQEDANQNGNCSAFSSWHDCTTNPELCSDTQTEILNEYISTFNNTIFSTPLVSRDGNGAFMYPCYAHCGAQFNNFQTFAVGNVTMQQALGRWWRANSSDPASEHTFLPCLYNVVLEEGQWRQCNPSCYIIPP